MNPLAIEIWLYILAAYIVVSTTIYIVARFSPYEWHSPSPCQDNKEVMQNDFTLSNSFWFTIGTLMQQGSDLNPKVPCRPPPTPRPMHALPRMSARPASPPPPPPPTPAAAMETALSSPQALSGTSLQALLFVDISFPILHLTSSSSAKEL